MTASLSTLLSTVSIISAISSIRSSLAPRVVMAGVPRRMPEVWKAERVSKGTMFLFTVMSADTSAFSATLPVRSGYFVRRSTSIEWLSVPPLTMLNPRSMRAWASVAAFFFTCMAYSFHSGCRISLKATALAAMTCSSGPPCMPGKTAESSNCDIIFTSPFGVVLPQGLGKSLPIRMIPPRGPRSVLWVVEVTMWAYFTGLSSRPAAISPAGWAMSIMRMAPTLSAMSRIRR